MYFTDETMYFICIRLTRYLILQKETDHRVGFLLTTNDSVKVLSCK